MSEQTGDFRKKAVLPIDWPSWADDAPREMLYGRIEKRVDEMLCKGLVEEVRGVLESGLDPNARASMQGLGYKEIADYIIEAARSNRPYFLIKQNYKKVRERH
jgi:tRNA dimethylallyltransferase